MTKPLTGIRVLDLSRLLPGPYATMMLADLGAEVIKIEEPGGGDYARFAPPSVGDYGALFASLNRGKKSVGLNFKNPAAVAAFKRMLPAADIVVDSFRPGVLDRLGLGYEAMRAINPRIILCSITGYGQHGPYRLRAGHDLNYTGLAGLVGVSGQDPNHPAFPGGQVADVGGGSLLAVVAMLAALLQRQHTGAGQWIDTSMTHGVLAFLTMHLAMHAADPSAGEPGPARMQLNGAHCCYQVYRTADDRWMTLGALEPKFWENFCTAIGRDDLRGSGFAPARPGDPTYDATVTEFSRRSLAEWVSLNEQFDFCCEPVLRFGEVREHPQLRDMFFDLIVGENRMPQVEVPLGMASVTGRGATPPPRLGEHTEEVLRAAGLSPDEIRALV